MELKNEMAHCKTLLPKLFWSILSCENTGPMVFKAQVLTMDLDKLLHEQLMQAVLGRGNPRDVFRTMMQIKRNEIF